MTDLKTYERLCSFDTLEDRIRYLRTNSKIGEYSFGAHRAMNQEFYNSEDWRRVRRQVILRDDGFDCGLRGFPICGPIIIHHINPITIDDILHYKKDKLLNLNNLISVSENTHKLIHFGSTELLFDFYMGDRRPNDTVPWR